LILSLYILPAVAAILKTRKRKLEHTASAEINSLKSSSNLVGEQIAHTVSFLDTLLGFKAKTTKSNDIVELQLLPMKSLASRKFCFGLLNQVELSTFLYV